MRFLGRRAGGCSTGRRGQGQRWFDRWCRNYDNYDNYDSHDDPAFGCGHRKLVWLVWLVWLV